MSRGCLSSARSRREQLPFHRGLGQRSHRRPARRRQPCPRCPQRSPSPVPAPPRANGRCDLGELRDEVTSVAENGDLRTMTFVAPRILPNVIVGRDEQLAALVETFEIVRRGRSTTVLLGGDAGVGKTTLVEAFCAQLGEACVIRGQCVPLGGDGLAFAPIIGALRDLTQTARRRSSAEVGRAGRRRARHPAPGVGRRCRQSPIPTTTCCACSRPSPRSSSAPPSPSHSSSFSKTCTGPMHRRAISSLSSSERSPTPGCS